MIVRLSGSVSNGIRDMLGSDTYSTMKSSGVMDNHRAVMHVGVGFV